MQILDGVIERNEVNENARGGTELMTEALVNHLGTAALTGFQIIVSRLRNELLENKHRIYICHDLEGDQESQHLENEGWKRFHKIVFVSHWQQQRFIARYEIPWSRTIVLKNAIEPIDVNLEKKFSTKKKKLNIVYHTTPHRGLNILVPVFKKICEERNDIHLHVFSSFNIYGWEDKDQDPFYMKLFDAIKEDKNMTYHGTVSNEEIRKQLPKMDIFAYPSVWLETSCISLMEAMSAGLFCIHPNSGALFETSANWTYMYNYHEDPNQHANMFYNHLRQSLDIVKECSSGIQMKLMGQKSYADLFYSWPVRLREWENILNHVKSLPLEIEKTAGEVFVYRPTL